MDVHAREHAQPPAPPAPPRPTAGDAMHMWFVSAWHAWRSLVVGRLRFRCFVAHHMARLGTSGAVEMGLDTELCFRGWAKAARAQVTYI